MVRYIGWSVDPDRQAGMLVDQATLMDRLVCRSVSLPGLIGWCVGNADNRDRWAGMLVELSIR